MGIKRVVDVKFWDDDKVQEMFSPEDKYFMLYLLTNSHCNMLGIYPITKKAIAFETGYSIDTINNLIGRFETKYNMIRYDENTKEIAIKNFLKYSVFGGGKPVEDRLNKDIKDVKNKGLIAFVVKSVYGNVENETVNKVLQEIKDTFEIEDYVEKTYTIETQTIQLSPTKKEKKEKEIDYDFFEKTYNTTCSSLPEIKKMSDNRKKAIKTFLKSYSEEDFKNVCMLVNESDFLSGRSSSKWCNFDWLIKKDNALKVLEGNYKNKENKNKTMNYLEELYNETLNKTNEENLW